jgi:hypothetical protein
MMNRKQKSKKTSAVVAEELNLGAVSAGGKNKRESRAERTKEAAETSDDTFSMRLKQSGNRKKSITRKSPDTSVQQSDENEDTSSDEPADSPETVRRASPLSSEYMTAETSGEEEGDEAIKEDLKKLSKKGRKRLIDLLLSLDGSSPEKMRKPGEFVRIRGQTDDGTGKKPAGDEGAREGTAASSSREPVMKRSITDCLRGWQWPSFKDETSLEGQRLKWPVWKAAMLRGFEAIKHGDNEWSQAEKFTVLATFAGERVSRLAMDLEQRPPSADFELYKFDELLKACEIEFRPRNRMAELSKLRARKQEPGEALSAFMDTAAQQADLCGFTPAQREEELLWVLRSKTINRGEIERRTINMDYKEALALAGDLEDIRLRELGVEAEGQQEDGTARVLAVGRGPTTNDDRRGSRDSGQTDHGRGGSGSGWSGRQNKPRVGGAVSRYASGESYKSGGRDGKQSAAEARVPKGKDCNTCGRFRGHSPGRTCPALRNTCSKCNAVGHYERVCEEVRRSARVEHREDSGWEPGEM